MTFYLLQTGTEMERIIKSFCNLLVSILFFRERRWGTAPRLLSDKYLPAASTIPYESLNYIQAKCQTAHAKLVRVK